MKTIIKFLIIQIFFLLSFNSSALAYNFSWSTHEDITNKDNPKCTNPCGCNADGSNKSCEEKCKKKTGSPVLLQTGLFVWNSRDISLTGKPSLTLDRHYTAFDSHLGLFGNSWISSFEKIFFKTVQYSKDENGIKKGETYFIYRGGVNGERYFYKYNENNDTFINIGNFSAKAKKVDEHIATLTYFGGIVETYRDGYLVQREDKSGNKLILTYDDVYLLEEVSNGHSKLTFTYNSNGFVSQVTDHTGRVWQYDYDTNGNLIEVLDPVSGTKTYAYQTFKFSNDAQVSYLITEIKDATDKVVVSATYDGNGKISTYTEGAETYRYSYSNNTIYKTNSSGRRIVYTVDDAGYIVKVVDPLGNSTYDIDDESNRTITTVDATGKKWLEQKDERKRTTLTIDPLGNKTQYQYNGDNPNPVKIISPKGYVTTMTYDSNYNLLTATNPKGNSATLIYDSKGNIVSITDAKGAKTTITYNALSLPASTKDALGRTTTFAYDSLSRKISQTDPSGKTTQFEYDDLDRVTKVTNALGHEITYSYDEAGRVTTIKDPVGNETKYEYDSYGRLAKEIRPDAKETTYSYRNDNLVSSISRYDGKSVTFGYDANKRVTSQRVGSDTVNYSYNALNYITQVRNSTATINYSYDVIGRVTRESINGVNIDRTYDEESSLKTLAFLGKTISYSRDNLGIATTINNGTDSFGFTYDKNSFLTQIALPNGVNEDYTFNSVGELTQMVSSVSNIAYEYDNRGLISKKTVGGDVFNYGYDAIGRLTSENANSFSYDIAGNNLNNNASYNTQNNQMVQSDKFAFEYDNSGNVAKKIDKTTNYTKLYTFNDRNQLSQVVTQDDSNQTTKTLAFTYDPVGRRYSKSVNGAIEKFIYDGMDIVAIVDNSNNIISTITHSEGIDQPLSISDGTDTYYYLRDHQGSVIALVDSSGTKVEEYNYDAYGKVTTKNSTATTHNPYGYTGRIMDDDDLYYYRARYYDPTSQRFLSEDPIGFNAGDINLYRYVYGSPTMFRDPSGKFIFLIPIIGFIFEGGAVAIGITTVAVEISTTALVTTAVIGGSALILTGDSALNQGNILQMASRGNVADTAITQALQREGTGGKNRCDWLKENASRFPKSAVKATEKAWGCRHSRASKDKCKK